MATVAKVAKRTVPGASEVSVTLVKDGNASTVAFTGQVAVDVDERQYDKGYGPCLDSLDAGEPVRINSMRGKRRWRDWAAEASQLGAGSSLSLPVPVQREVQAALNILVELSQTSNRKLRDVAAALVADTAPPGGTRAARQL